MTDFHMDDDRQQQVTMRQLVFTEQNPVPPPGPGDIATFGDLGSNPYTVNVTTNIDVADILIATETSTASISISGSLTTDDIVYETPAIGGIATSMTVNAGGLLDIANLLNAARIARRR